MASGSDRTARAQRVDEEIIVPSRQFSAEHKQHLKDAWTAKRRKQASCSRLGKKRGHYRKG